MTSIAVSHISVTSYNITSGSKTSSQDIPASWITEGSKYVEKISFE